MDWYKIKHISHFPNSYDTFKLKKLVWELAWGSIVFIRIWKTVYTCIGYNRIEGNRVIKRYYNQNIANNNTRIFL